MKRLILMFIAAIFAVFCMHSAVAAKTFCEAYPDSSRCIGGQQEKPNSVIRAYRPGHMNGFLPEDASYDANTPGHSAGNSCDANGYDVRGTSQFRCRVMSSKTTGLTYRVQAHRIFTVEDGKPVIYVEFNQNGSVIRESISRKAEQFAATSGYKLDPATNRMVAINAGPAAPPRVIDCKDTLNINDRLACTKQGNYGTQNAQTAPVAPVPQAAQADPCAKLDGFLKMKCDANAALSGTKAAIGAGLKQ
jgi:hypothetical protein